jgi:hypothetical protein
MFPEALFGSMLEYAMGVRGNLEGIDGPKNQ